MATGRDHTAGTGLFIQWINSEYMENKFKISSNTNSLIIFWIYLKFILQFVSILFSAYIQNIVVGYTVNILKSKCGGHLSTATCYLHQIDLLSCEIWWKGARKGRWSRCITVVWHPAPRKRVHGPAWSSSRSPHELYGNPNKLILMCSC